MSLKYKLKTIVFFVLFSFFSGCDRSSEFQGVFVYSDGGSINVLNLNSIESSVKVDFKGGGYNISDVTSFGDNSILYSACSKYGCDSYEYSFIKKRSRVVASGFRPFYMRNHKEILIYDSGSSGTTLYAQSLGDSKKRKIAEVMGLKLPNGSIVDYAGPIVKISDNLVTFITKGNELKAYNSTTREVFGLGFNDCIPVAWLAKANSLLCSKVNSRVSFLLDVETGLKIGLPFYFGFNSVSYSKKYNAIIYQKPRFSFLYGEVSDLYAYMLDEGREVKIKNKIFSVSGYWQD
ncbi:hypothetical protein [Pseudoalteromonas sp. T1lg10]|uniref:hypothetical protein n=1 Tax=Pseudoalteromonas sp. T1lg10 TaxID=2077093 RepID=UPI000CF74F66|nr:hypothetical protein [Pseudoalteromonas sp. T1lg10]